MRRLPPLDALRAFEAAARHLSFTRAADEIHVTQGAISHRIRALEAELGLALFRRLTRRLELTEAGEILARAVRRGLDEFAGGLLRAGARRGAGRSLARQRAAVVRGALAGAAAGGLSRPPPRHRDADRRREPRSPTCVPAAPISPSASAAAATRGSRSSS